MRKDSEKDAYTVDFLTLCDYVSVSQDNKLSILGLFDRIFVAQVPASHAKCFIVAILRGPANSECQVKIEFVTPERKEVFKDRQISMKVKLGASGVGNILNELVNIPIEMSGEYNVRMQVNGVQLKEIPLYVQKVMTNENPGKLPN